MKRHWSSTGVGGGGLLSGMEIDEPGEDAIDRLYKKLIDADAAGLPLPPLGAQPHLLSSRVRKHYFESVIKLLSLNYEHSQRLPGKNIRLPTAIWRCAKYIETQAVQACMIMHLYRENILVAVKQLKADTANRKLYRKLFEYMNTAPQNDKGVQVNCEPNSRNGTPHIKKRKVIHTQRVYDKNPDNTIINNSSSFNETADQITSNDNFEYTHEQSQADLQYRIPVLVNVTSQNPLQFVPQQFAVLQNPVHPANTNMHFTNTYSHPNINIQPNNTVLQPTNANIKHTLSETQNINTNIQPTISAVQPFNTQCLSDNNKMLPTNTVTNTQVQNIQNESNVRLSIESQDSEDQVMQQMEELFRNDDDDDIFEGAFSNNMDVTTITANLEQEHNTKEPPPQVTMETENRKYNETAIKSLDERIAILSSVGVLAPLPPLVQNESPKPKRLTVSKWLCEDYYRKLFFYEKFDDICENNRKKYERLLKKFAALFDEDGEEHQAISPQEETPELILSCKERVGPFIVKNLMPYYNKGRIKTRALFKNVAKYIIKGLIECNRFPDEYEVYTYITDFFRVRPAIRCEADYKF